MHISRITRLSALALLCCVAPLTSLSSADQCGCERPCPTCEKRCCSHRKHCGHLAAPPLAPVLGSAPAMMAPIVFTPVGPTALPAPYQAAPPQQPDKEVLRELMRSIMQSPAASPPPCSCNSGGNGSSAAPLAAPQPPQDNQVLDRLDRIGDALANLDGRMRTIESWDARIRALESLDARIKTLEKR